MEHRLLELPYAQHGFDLSWGGWGSQITRPELERFLEQHLRGARPENAVVIDTGGQRSNPSAIEVPAMYGVEYLGVQDSPPVNYRFIRIRRATRC